jgi:hypothetical protein
MIFAGIIIGILIALVVITFNARSDYKQMETIVKNKDLAIDYYKAQNGDVVAKVDAIEVDYHQMKQLFTGAIKKIENLKIKPNRVTSYSDAVIEQNKQFYSFLRDSIIYVTDDDFDDSDFDYSYTPTPDTIEIFAKAFNYSDNYYDVNGLLIDDSLSMNIHSVDTLYQVVYKGKRKKPWMWILSRRQLEQVISNTNPNNKIIYSRHIDVE